MKLFAAVPLSVLSFLFAGCVASSDAASNDDEVPLDGAEEALTSAPSNFGYFQVTRPDVRRCAAPQCGGFFVKRVNEPTTACADGSKQAECYVSTIQLTGVGLSQREEAEFRTALEGGKGLIKARTYRTKVNGKWIGTLKANEAWRGATGGVADGTFYRAADNGVRCITAPCPSTTVSTLNSNDSHNVIDVRLSNTEVPADEATLDRANAALATKEGILVAGGLALPKCRPSATQCGPFVTAQEFYLRVTRREGKACGSWSAATCNDGQFCSWAAGDFCGAADAPGTCTYKPEMCPQVFMPVCGCDGKTYGNSCTAGSAGVSVASAGACSDPNLNQ